MTAAFAIGFFLGVFCTVCALCCVAAVMVDDPYSSDDALGDLPEVPRLTNPVCVDASHARSSRT